MTKKNIVISPCGNKSTLFQTQWLKNKEQKDFDLCLLFYHAEINDPDLYEDAEYFYHLKNFKFSMIYDLLTHQAPQLLEQYDYFYFIDDDVGMDTDEINKMFAFSKAFDLWLTQASLSQDSFNSWPILKQQPDCVLRYMGQIEVMAPLFSQYALKQCLSSFVSNRSSWGFDSVWSKMLGYPQSKIAVVDAVIMRHTQPVGGGELYRKLQIDPYVEWKQVTEQYDAIANNFFELGRVQTIGKKTSKWLYRIVQIRVDVKKVIRETTRGNLLNSIVSRLKDRTKNHTKGLSEKEKG